MNGKVSYNWYDKNNNAYQYFDTITDSGTIYLKKTLTEKGRNFKLIFFLNSSLYYKYD